MSLARILLVLLLALPVATAQELPELGDVSQSVFSPAMERQVGEGVMARIRADRTYLDDPEVKDYLQGVGERLAAASPDTRQPFEFFMMQDPTVNAFALPGGFIGVHSGLFVTAQSESELAAVLAHEVAHVTQRHIARLIAGQQKTQLASLAALAVGILAARANSQLGQAVIAGAQAATIQSALDYTRDHEREADRIGLQILEKAGFDPRAMPVLLERMQRAGRLYEGNAPSYLRTHPVTHERIADIQNRTEVMPYRQVPDNPEFQLMRAKLRALLDEPRQAVAWFDESQRERRYISEAATRYGLAVALVRARDYARADRELDQAVRMEGMAANPAIATLRGRLLAAQGGFAKADAHYSAALKEFPRHRALLYDYADLLIGAGKADVALRLVEATLASAPDEPRLYALQARSYAALGRRLLQHRAQAEAYARLGNVGAAIEQLQIALKAGDGDFYQLSSVEARLRELKVQDAERRKKE